jgi:hypothetical protein
MVPGGMVDIPPGSFVEGSEIGGGIQPDYFLDIESKAFREMSHEALAIADKKMPFWQTVDEIARYVAQKLPGKEYTNEDYRRILAEHHQGNIPLSKYISCGVGVCREHALILHFLLKEAGIKNFHVYAQIQHGENFREAQHHKLEDHAFVVVKHKGKIWTIDPYNWGFHGFELKGLFTEGTPASPARAPIASEETHYRRRIVQINEFPRVWVPKKHLKLFDRESIALPQGCDSLGFNIRNNL